MNADYAILDHVVYTIDENNTHRRNKKYIKIMIVSSIGIICITLYFLLIYLSTYMVLCDAWPQKDSYECVNYKDNSKLLGLMTIEMCDVRCAYFTSSNSCCKYDKKKNLCWIIRPYSGINKNGSSYAKYCGAIYGGLAKNSPLYN